MYKQRAQPDLEEGLTRLSPRTHYRESTSEAWNLYWEAGPYYQRVADALENANSYAVFVGWQIDSRVELSTKRKEGFRDLVLRVCREKPDFHVYFLMWDYAYFYVFERELLQGWTWDNIHERVHFVFDNRHPYAGSHHEKMVIIDGELAFVGGVDICDDRWDRPQHFYKDDGRSLRHDHEEHLPYHDVIAEVRGEVAADLVEHVAERWRGVSSIPFPERVRVARSEGRGHYHLLLSRTRAKVGTERPLLIRETEFLFRELIRSARHQLVIENQYYWSKAINDEITALLRARAGTGFRLFLVVPSVYGGSFAFRMMGRQQMALVDDLTRVAEETGTRFVFGCPFTRNAADDSEKSIYVHSKVLIVDDHYMAVGSSNFNNRGFRLDTEITLTLVGDTAASRARITECAEHIVGHWGPQAFSRFYGRPAGPGSAPPYVYLKSYHRSWDHYFSTREGWFASHVPLEKVFDPPVPLGYVFKARLSIGNIARLRRILPLITLGTFLLLLGLSLLLTGTFARLAGPAWQLPQDADSIWWLVVCAFFLSCSWLVPVPTVLSAAFTGVLLGARPGALLVASSLWIAAQAGYGFARVFPEFAQRMFERIAPTWLPETIGRRRLPIALHVTCNPRLSFQAKVAYHGIFAIPARWFVGVALVPALANATIAFLAGSLHVAGSESVLFLGYVVVTLSLIFRRSK